MAEIAPGESVRNQLQIEKLRKAQQIYPIELRHTEKNVNMLAFNASETLFASCSSDSTVNVYNAINYKMINQFKTGVALKYICFSRSGLIIAAGIFENIFIMDPFDPPREDRPPPPALSYLRANISALDVSPEDKHLGVLYSRNVDGSRVAVLAAFSLPALSPASTCEGLLAAKTFELPAGAAVKFKFFLGEDRVFFAGPERVWRISLSTSELQAGLPLPDVTKVLALTFSPRFDFLILSGSESVRIIDPLELTVLRNFEVKYPANCAQISPLAYAPRPKFHLIIGGGIEAIHQAMRSEGGNQVLIYDFAAQECVGDIRGFYACINWLIVFKDGSGFITAGEEGSCRIYRFDASYYEAGQ